MRYYEDNEDGAFEERIFADKALDFLNWTSGASFVFGLVFSSIFVFFNIPEGETAMSKGNEIPLSKGKGAPTAESRPRPLGGVPAPTYEKKPATQPAPVPEPAKPSQADKN